MKVNVSVAVNVFHVRFQLHHWLVSFTTSQST